MTKTIFILSILFSVLAFSANQKNSELECEVLKKSEKMILNKCDNLKVLYLKGTPTERAQIHGQLMTNEIQRAPMNYFSERVFQEVEDANFIVKGIFKSIYSSWIGRFIKAAPEKYRKEMEAQAEGAKTDVSHFHRAIALPDTSAFLTNLAERGFFNTFVTFGCTSVVKKNQDGRFLYGRNLDFASTTIFDKYPLMLIHLPEEGSEELKHISFATDGMQFAGITGVNEAGITFAVHQYQTKDADKFGVPMPLVGEEVLRKAKSLEEAADIIKQNRTGPMWVFVISDLNKKQAWSVEVSSQNFAIRKMENNEYVQTNHVLAAPQEVEIASAGFLMNSQFRFQKAMEMLSKSKNLETKDIADILSYQKDPNGELSASEDILKGENIQSLVFEASESKKLVNMTIDEAPASSGRYAQFDLDQLFKTSDIVKYKIFKLSSTPAEKRKIQLKLATATYLQDKANMKEAVQVFAGQKSIDSMIYRAVGYYQLDQVQESMKLIQSLKKETSKETLQGQSVLWLEMYLLLKSKKSKEAKNLAEEILGLKILDPVLQKVAKKIKDGEELEDEQMKLKYSLFSGYISNSGSL